MSAVVSSKLLHLRLAQDLASTASQSHIRLAVAFSGGADSTALAHVASEWAREAPTQRSVLALHVNHNVRAESTAEQAHVLASLRRSCAHVHLQPLSIAWPGGAPPPPGQLQQECRNRRYALLSDACRSAGVDVLLTAHHLNDQAETIMLRLSRSSGLRGLAAMRSVLSLTSYGPAPHVRLWRPLLDVRKADLVAYCREHRLDWIEDPSNQNLYFRRVHARRLVDVLESQFDVPLDTYPAVAHAADTATDTLEQAATEFLKMFGRHVALARPRRLSTTAEAAAGQLDLSTVCTHVDGRTFIALPEAVAVRALMLTDPAASIGAARNFLKTVSHKVARGVCDDVDFGQHFKLLFRDEQQQQKRPRFRHRTHAR